MTAPVLTAYINGQGQVSGDNLNTFMQTCNNASDLRAFGGTGGIEVYMRGFATVGDGGQGVFYWNSSSTAPDDGGITTIVPSSSTAGAWNRLSQVGTLTYSIQVPTAGFSITVGNATNVLILNPVATLATGTIILPPLPLKGQTVRIATEQAITALLINANSGQTIIGPPTTLAQYGSVTFLYNLDNLTWYRI